MVNEMTSTFTCACCEQTYTKIRSDEEAEAEHKELWGVMIPEEAKEVVCDDCFKKELPHMKKAEQAATFHLKCVGPGRHRENRPASECKEMPFCKTCSMPMVLDTVVIGKVKV